MAKLVKQWTRRHGARAFTDGILQDMAGALDGVLVVTVEQAVAAPYCAARLADGGARVLKIERPEGVCYWCWSADLSAVTLFPRLLPLACLTRTTIPSSRRSSVTQSLA